MSKTSIKLSPAAASNIYLGVQSLQAAEQYFASAAHEAKHEFVDTEMTHAKSNIKLIISRIEKRIPKTHKEAFQTQIINNDPLRIENIKHLYTELMPEQQEIIENLMIAIKKGDKITVEQSISQ